MAINSSKIKKILIIFLRIIMGIMWSMSGVTWLTRDDPEGYLLNAIYLALDTELTYSFYLGFLKEVVIPKAPLFASLVSIGEFLTGISLLSGTLSKIGASGAIFLLLNYAFMNGSLTSPFGLLFLTIHIFLLLNQPGRHFGFDALLHRKWPDIRLF